jgi:hypothetical protein
MRRSAGKGTGELLSIALLLSAFAWAGEAQAQGQRAGSLTASLMINVSSEVSFPDGTEFVLSVPSDASPQDATVPPVQVPFIVRGNAAATVSAQPDPLLSTPQGFFYGRELGADGGAEPFGYDIIIQFPVSPLEFAGLPEHWGLGASANTGNDSSFPVAVTAEISTLPAEMLQVNNIAYGTIQLVPRLHGTPDDRKAKAGIYRGRINVTVATDRR